MSLRQANVRQAYCICARTTWVLILGLIFGCGKSGVEADRARVEIKPTTPASHTKEPTRKASEDEERAAALKAQQDQAQAAKLAEDAKRTALPQKETAPRVRKWHRSLADIGGGPEAGLNYALLPIGKDRNDRPNPKTLLQNLIRDMAQDAETIKLLKEMLGCEVVLLVSLEKTLIREDTAPQQPPSAHPSVYIGWRIFPEEPGVGAAKEAYSARVARLIYHTWERDDGKVWNQWNAPPRPVDLAINEYLLRKRTGYYLFPGRLNNDPEQKLDKRLQNEQYYRDFVSQGIQKILDSYKMP